MKDLLVRVRGGGTVWRVKPGQRLVINAKSLGSELYSWQKTPGIDNDYEYTYDQLLPSIGTKSSMFIVRYAKD